MRETKRDSEVMAATGSNKQKVSQAVQAAAVRSFTRACELFCCPLVRGQVTCCPAQTHRATGVKAEQVAQIQPSVILIVNISNSTLVQCVIGNDNRPATVQESQPLMSEPGINTEDEGRCGYARGQQETVHVAPPPALPPPPEEPPSISIQNSQLNCVIIGDNNYLNAEGIPVREALAPWGEANTHPQTKHS